jgi:hypothetical protein
MPASGRADRRDPKSGMWAGCWAEPSSMLSLREAQILGIFGCQVAKVSLEFPVFRQRQQAAQRLRNAGPLEETVFELSLGSIWKSWKGHRPKLVLPDLDLTGTSRIGWKSRGNRRVRVEKLGVISRVQ